MLSRYPEVACPSMKNIFGSAPAGGLRSERADPAVDGSQLKVPVTSCWDELRKLSIDTQINLQKKASSAIGHMDDVIIDTHMSIKSPRGYLPGLPEWVLRELKVSSYFVLEADPETIKKRRELDGTRARDEDKVNEIREHQEINRYYAAAYSVYTGATVNYIIMLDCILLSFWILSFCPLL